MSYRGIERDFSQMHVSEHHGQKFPPTVAPKPKVFNAAPAPYRPGDGYKKVNFGATKDYPLPPPPEQFHGYSYQDHQDFPPPPPPPPPATSHGYEPVRAKTAYIVNSDYDRSNYSPSQPFFSRDGRNSPYTPNQSSNYMNINMASDQTGRPRSGEFRQERQLPGPPIPIITTTAPESPKEEKEAEVDALTNLLMQSIESSAEPDFYGVCGKCNMNVLGESNGCTAMDQIYHIGCFVCVSCGCGLQGKSFFQMENKPYCESCYMNTLEKCSVCSKAITDRLLRATGRPYHPACFTCVVCGISLDGIPFTVDATNQIHCIKDFHNKFAPRCCSCNEPIMPEAGQDETVRIVAMDKSFHVSCYRCEDCGMQLSSEAEGRGCYPLDDHILCKNCNAKRIQAMSSKMATEL
ncbi:hypothetical protein SNE40_014392 [Patella caerulea]|uniref:LIM zinc-binding domain-containing protein n=1 Tax=Patella caerulea TaxID=87958 RepID=A0AAN8JHW4_PATCE